MSEAFGGKIRSLEIAPDRRIILHCQMTNHYEYPLTGIEVVATITAHVGGQMVRLAEGLRGYVGRGEPPSAYYYPPKLDFELIAIVPVTNEQLAEIESIRTDDVSLSIMGEVSYSIAHQLNENAGHWAMGERRWNLLTRNGRPDNFHCPQSEWLKHLARLKWNDYEVLEIPRNKGDSRFSRAYEQLGKASSQYRNGQWDSCALHCRKAYEAAMKDATGDDELKRAAEAVLSRHAGVKKERLTSLLLALGAYTHLARHEGLEQVHFDRFDAAQVLFMTTAAVDFIANQ